MLPLLIIHIVLYALGIAGGIIVSIPLILDIIDFNGNCVLYTTGSWADLEFTAIFGNVSLCRYAVVLAVVLALYSLLMLAYCIHLVRTAAVTGRTMLIFIPMISNSALALMQFVSAAIISAGFKKICDSLNQIPDVKTNGCRYSQTYLAWKNGVDGKRWYDITMVAQLAAWGLFLLFGVIATISIVRFVKEFKKGRTPPTDKELVIPT